MWLQLSQIKKKLRDVTKIGKTRKASRVGIHFGARSCDAISRARKQE